MFLEETRFLDSFPLCRQPSSSSISQQSNPHGAEPLDSASRLLALRYATTKAAWQFVSSIVEDLHVASEGLCDTGNLFRCDLVLHPGSLVANVLQNGVRQGHFREPAQHQLTELLLQVLKLEVGVATHPRYHRHIVHMNWPRASSNAEGNIEPLGESQTGFRTIRLTVL